MSKEEIWRGRSKKIYEEADRERAGIQDIKT